MNDIRIYDFEFNLLHIEPNVMSAYWILYYNDIGTFEGTFPLTSDICDVIMKNKYLVLIQGDLQAIITAYMADTKLTVYGKTVNWIMSRRTCPAFNTTTLYPHNEEIAPGDVMVKMASQIFSDVSNFEFVNSTDIITSEPYSKNSRMPFSDVLKEYLNQFNLGHKVQLDIPNKKWVFEVYSGRVLPGIFSEGNRNLKDITISDDAQGFFPSGWYNRELEDLGDWDAASSLPTVSSDNYGKYYSIRNENENESEGNSKYPNGSYLVCADSTGNWRVCSELPTLEEKIQGTLTGIYDWDIFLSGASPAEAKAELLESKWTHDLKAFASRLKYKADYSLGDTLRIQAQKGSCTEATEKIVSSVDIWWESGSEGEKLKFKEEI